MHRKLNKPSGVLVNWLVFRIAITHLPRPLAFDVPFFFAIKLEVQPYLVILISDTLQFPFLLIAQCSNIQIARPILFLPIIAKINKKCIPKINISR